MLQVILHQNRESPYVLNYDFQGGSAKAAGELVKKLGGKTLEYLFVIGMPFLKGTEQLDAPSYVMIEAEE